MSLFDKIAGEFIDIIEWNDATPDTLVWRFPRYQDEIKNGAKLTVRPSQVAVFVNQGQIADVFEPGMHTLATANLPVLSTMRGWKYGFDSPFKAEVYFVSTRQFADLKWGTKNPVMVRDADFGMVRLRAFGTYVIKVADPRKVIEQVAGTNPQLTIEGMRDALRNILTSKFSDLVASARVPVLDLATRYDELSAEMLKIAVAEFERYGLSATQVLVENISLPEEVEKAIDTRSKMGALGNLDQYAKFQAANAMEAAAHNPGSAGTILGLGVGSAIAGQMFAQPAAAAPAPSAPPPVTAAPPPMPGMAPPPLPAKVWWVALQGQQNGPHDANTVAEYLQQKQIDGNTLVWKQGLANWQPLLTIPELAQFVK